MFFSALLNQLLWAGSPLPFALLFLASSVAAANISSMTVSHPAINFDATGGQIGVLGDFDGLSFYNVVNASSFLAAPAPDTLSLYWHNSTSGQSVVVASVEGGTVNQMLKLASPDIVLVSGTFTKINDVGVTPPVIFNTSLHEVTQIVPSNQGQQQRNKRADTFTGLVLTTFVDGDLIYLGGDFEYNNTYGAAVYNQTSRSLMSLPFKGFGEHSTVRAIAKYPPDEDDGSILFGGSFDTLGFPELLTHNISHPMHNASNSTNATLITAEQVISLKPGSFANVNGLPSNDDRAIICPSTSPTWALQDGIGGEWSFLLPLAMQGTTPTKVRIYVPEDSLNGIREFRIYTYPNNGIMNLTYVDPETNEVAFCDAACPLHLASSLQSKVERNKDEADSYDDDLDVYIDENGSYSMYFDPETQARLMGYGRNYQEFALVNDVMIDALTLTTVSWYGSRGEFSGFELYLDSITVYGIETLNESNCGNEAALELNNAVINSGIWDSVQSLIAVPHADYLVSVVEEASSITLYPNVSYGGDYSILFYTPGCRADQSCLFRSQVNVTLIDNFDRVLSSHIIFQNNLENKFDYLYFGHLNGSSENNGRNKVRIDYHSAIDSNSFDQWVVVDRVVANMVSLDDSLASKLKNSTKNATEYALTTMSLNGLFEYSLANFTTFSEDLVYDTVDDEKIIHQTNTFVGNSSINVLSGKLSNSSSVSNIVYSPSNEMILLNGNFTSLNVSLTNSNLISLVVAGYNSTANDTRVSSIMKRLRKREEQTILGANFNDSVTSIHSIDDGIVVLGEFSMTDNNGVRNLTAGNNSATSANNFALYSDRKWYSFGNEYLSSDFSQFVSIGLDGTQYFVFSSPDGRYLSWDNTRKEWSNGQYKLNVTTSLSLSDGQQVIGGPSFGTMDYFAKDQGSFKNYNGFQSLGAAITDGSVLTSFYLNSSLSVIGGSFKGNSSIEKVALLKNNNSVALNGNIQWSNDTAVTTAYISTDQEFLFLGTNDSAVVRDSNVTGLLVYNLKNESFLQVQPPDLSTSDGSPVLVNALALYDESSYLLVGGNFASAGSLGCQSVCLYNIPNTRWESPYASSLSPAIGGVVTDARFVASDTILLSGGLTFNGSSTNFVVYDFSTNTFASVASGMNNTGVSGIIKKYTVNDDSRSSLNARMTAIGSNFILGFDGNTWSRIDKDIEISNQTHFSDLKLVQLSLRSSNNSNKTYFDDNQALLVSGSFNITHYGLVNIALYDGKNWVPYVFSLKDWSLGHVNSLLLEDLYKSQSSSDLARKKNQLTVGQVVGISLACAIGSTALLGLLYIIPAYFLLKDSKSEAVDQRIYEDEMMDVVNPKDLIHEMDVQRNY